jgi:hypothetical protein
MILLSQKCGVLANDVDRENAGVVVEHVGANGIVTVNDVGVVVVVGIVVIVLAVVVDAGETVVIQHFMGV